MSSFVLDASVAAKWFLPSAHEPLVIEALALLRSYTQGQLRFIVPDLFWAEFGNVMWKAARLGRCSRQEAESAIAVMREHRVPAIASAILVKDAFAIAANFNRTVYDSIYVALAVTSHTPLITADEKLAGALALYFPVKWLGAHLT